MVLTPLPPIRWRSGSTLNAKQELFVREYLVDGNGTRAATAAGYSARTAESQGSRLLRNVKVAAAIAAGQRARSERLEVTADQIGAELALIAFANMGDYFTVGGDGFPRLQWSRLTRRQTAPLAEVTVDSYLEGGGDEAREVKRVKFKLSDKQGALVHLAKLLGFWKEGRAEDEALRIAAILEELEARRVKA